MPARLTTSTRRLPVTGVSTCSDSASPAWPASTKPSCTQLPPPRSCQASSRACRPAAGVAKRSATAWPPCTSRPRLSVLPSMSMRPFTPPACTKLPSGASGVRALVKLSVSKPLTQADAGCSDREFSVPNVPWACDELSSKLSLACGCSAATGKGRMSADISNRGSSASKCMRWPGGRAAARRALRGSPCPARPASARWIKAWVLPDMLRCLLIITFPRALPSPGLQPCRRQPVAPCTARSTVHPSQNIVLVFACARPIRQRGTRPTLAYDEAGAFEAIRQRCGGARVRRCRPGRKPSTRRRRARARH